MEGEKSDHDNQICSMISEISPEVKPSTSRLPALMSIISFKNGILHDWLMGTGLYLSDSLT